MQIPTLYLTIAAEVFGVFLLIITLTIFLQSRDRKKLLAYVEHLKGKIINLKRKLTEHAERPDPTQELLGETIEHVKAQYEQEFGHEMGGKTSVKEDNSKEHFLYIMGYQSLKAELSAIQNSRTADNTWDKIASQLSPLIDNFRSKPETEVLAAEAENLSSSDDMEHMLSNAVASAAKSNKQAPSNSQANSGSTELLSERRNEIERLKSQIATQFEDIWNLQSELSRKASDTNNPMTEEVNEGLESITRQLKDAELCITMMDAEILTANEEILGLKEQLDNTPASQGDAQQHNNLADELVKKEALIERTMQENKEMMTLIEGMEKHSDEQIQEIKDLQSELESLRALP